MLAVFLTNKQSLRSQAVEISKALVRADTSRNLQLTYLAVSAVLESVATPVEVVYYTIQTSYFEAVLTFDIIYGDPDNTAESVSVAGVARA
jgi:hypothetical protein